MTYEEAKAFQQEWCAGRRRLMVEGEGDALDVLSAGMDHCFAVEDLDQDRATHAHLRR